MQPAVFVFDKTPGGVGLCERLFESVTGWIHAALQLLTTCPCETGCPACLLSSRCESFNDVLNKGEAIRLQQAGISQTPSNS
jgi:DEAD/DEAH box helicase domain-containing protein